MIEGKTGKMYAISVSVIFFILSYIFIGLKKRKKYYFDILAIDSNYKMSRFFYISFGFNANKIILA